MKLISFSWTSEALLAGAKTVTRRDWTEDYAKSFRRGELVQAYDRNPRIGGKRVAIIRLTKAPYRQLTSRMTEEDYEAEGLGWMARENRLIQGRHPKDFFNSWKFEDEPVWVVPFEVVSYAPHA